MLYCPQMSTKRTPKTAQDAGMREELARTVRGYRVFREQGVLEAAEAIGMSRSWWSAIESAKTIPEAENLVKLARSIGAPEHELLRIAGYVDDADVAERIVTRQIDPDIAEVVRLVQEFLDEKRQRDAARSAEPDPAPRRSAPRASKPRPRAAHRVEDPS